MHLLRAFSHDPLTNKRGIKIIMIPEGVISSNFLKLIKERVERKEKKRKSPVEIGFLIDNSKYYPKELYTKSLLMAPKQ